MVGRLVRFVGFWLVSLLGGYDERRVVGLWGVLSLALVLDVSDVALVVVGDVVHNLSATVWELNCIGSMHLTTIAVLLLTELQSLVWVIHTVGELVRLGWFLVSLLVWNMFGWTVFGWWWSVMWLCSSFHQWNATDVINVVSTMLGHCQRAKCGQCCQ